MGIKVRKGCPDDLGWLLPELQEFSLFFGTRRQLYSDTEFVKIGLMEMMRNDVFLVAEREADAEGPVTPLGFIAGIVRPHMMNPAITCLNEVFWWVKESERKSRAAVLLFNEFVAWGKENVDWIFFALEAHSPVNEDALIDRGFRLQERNFIMEV